MSSPLPASPPGAGAPNAGDRTPTRRRGWRSRLAVLWAIPIIALPVGGALGIQTLVAGESSRQLAATDLVNLEADVNQATLYAGWAVALHWPYAQALAAIQTSDATVDADLRTLNREWAAGGVMPAVQRATSGFLAILDKAVTLLKPEAPRSTRPPRVPRCSSSPAPLASSTARATGSSLRPRRPETQPRRSSGYWSSASRCSSSR